MAQIPRLLHSYLTSVSISKMCSRDYLPFPLLLWAQGEKICWNLRSNILIKKKKKTMSKTQMSSFPEKGSNWVSKCITSEVLWGQIFQNHTIISLWSENEPNNMLEHQEVHIKSKATYSTAKIFAWRNVNQNSKWGYFGLHPEKHTVISVPKPQQTFHLGNYYQSHLSTARLIHSKLFVSELLLM